MRRLSSFRIGSLLPFYTPPHSPSAIIVAKWVRFLQNHAVFINPPSLYSNQVRSDGKQLAPCCQCKVGWEGENCDTCIPHPKCPDQQVLSWTLTICQQVLIIKKLVFSTWADIHKQCSFDHVCMGILKIYSYAVSKLHSSISHIISDHYWQMWKPMGMQLWGQ